MALDKETLKNGFKALLNELKNDTDQAQSIEKFASKMADAVDDYVKSAQVVGTDSSGGQITGTLQ